VTFVRNDVSEEHIASIIRETRIGELETLLSLRNTVSSERASVAITASVVRSSSISVTLMMEAMRSSETSVLKFRRHNIPESGILHSHRHENLKSYTALTGWAF
jgi:hypothetical protein